MLVRSRTGARFVCSRFSPLDSRRSRSPFRPTTGSSAGSALPRRSAYASVLAGQVTLNFFLNRAFVFEKQGESTLAAFVVFVAGIFAFRAADWLVYVLLVEVCGLYHLAVQFGDVLLFSVLKFAFAERVFRAR